MPSRSPSNLPAPSLRWARSIESDLDNLLRNAAQQSNLGDINNRGAKNSMAGAMRAIAALQEQNAAIIETQEQLAAQQTAIQQAQQDIISQNNKIQDQQDLLADAANVQSNSFSNNSGYVVNSGWYGGSMPSVTLSTRTGRLQVQYGGSFNSGNGVFVYSVVRNDTGAAVINRTTVFNDYSKRVAGTGGAAFIGSGFASTVLTGMPKDVSLTVKLEFYATANGTYLFGGSILSSPSL